MRATHGSSYSAVTYLVVAPLARKHSPQRGRIVRGPGRIGSRTNIESLGSGVTAYMYCSQVASSSVTSPVRSTWTSVFILVLVMIHCGTWPHAAEAAKSIVRLRTRCDNSDKIARSGAMHKFYPQSWFGPYRLCMILIDNIEE